MTVNVQFASPREIYFPGTAATPDAGPARQGATEPLLKQHLNGISNLHSAATAWWGEAKSHTASDLRATLQEISTEFPRDKVQGALAEIKENKQRKFHPQPVASTWWGDPILAGLTAVTGVLRFAGATGNAATVGLSRKPREAGNVAAAHLMATTTSPSVSPKPMPSDLNAIIDLRKFDEAKLLREWGAQFSAGDSIPARLFEMWKCLAPETETTKLPLDITQFESRKIRQFVDSLMASTGYASKTDGPIDQEFSQYLFKRWFLQLAAPQTGSGDDGHAAPFHKELLKLTHPDTPYRKSCGNGKDVAPLLPRIGVLKDELRASFLKSYRRFDADEAYGWAFRGLYQLFEPTLVHELPDAFRYGSLAWVQLSIGIALAGDDHVNWTPPELISLAGLVDVFAGDPHDESLLAIRRNAMRAVLRMAHAHGKLNLLTLPEIKQEDLESAFAFYQSQLSLETSKLPPMEELTARLPTRHAIAEKMLAESGMGDHTRLFGAFNRHFSNRRRVLAPNALRELSCIPWDKKAYSLADIYRIGCLPQMQWDESPLGIREKELLQAPVLTHDELEQRFNQAFDTAWEPLRRQILVPALQDRIERLSRRDEEFFRCGAATVKEFTGRVKTRQSMVRREILNHEDGPVKWLNIAAREAVLIELVLEKSGQKETRNYLVTLNPPRIVCYEGSARALLEKNLHSVFKPPEGRTLLALSDRYEPTYTEHKPDGGQDKLLETVSALLVGSRGEILRESAHQTTDAEKFKKEIEAMAWDLLPLHACVRELRANEAAAAFSCTFDAASIIPLLGASARLGDAGISAIKALTSAEISQLIKAVAYNSIAAGDRKTIEEVFKLMPSLVNFSEEGLRLFDPGFELFYRLPTLGFRLGKAGLRSLLQKMQHLPRLSPLKEIVEKSGQHAEKFYPGNGYWHARADAIMSSRHGRYVDAGGKRYGVFDWGENKNILTTPAGNDLRLVNPQSGLGYGPLLRKSGAPGRLELIRNTDRGAVVETIPLRVPDVLAHGDMKCRPKRAGEEGYSMICPVPLVPDARFGANVHAQQHASLMGWQLGVTEAGGHEPRAVNLLDIGFAASRFVRSQTWVPAVPQISSFYNPVSGRMQGADSTLQGFNNLRGRVLRLMNRDGNDECEYVLFRFTETNAQNELILHTRYVPFGSYREADGTSVGHFAIGPNRYSFQVDRGRILSEYDNFVDIHPATQLERDKFEKYQDLLNFNYNYEWVDYPGIVKLRGLSPARKAQFGLVTDRAKAILEDASYVLNDQPDIANKICSRFAADAPAAASLADALKKSVEKMLQSLPGVLSDNVIGFFSYQRGKPASQKILNGFAITYSMEFPLDFDHIKNAPINLRSDFIWDPRQLEIDKATLLLHELSHALIGTRDHIDGVGPGDIYAQGRNGRYDLQPLIDAAHISDAAALHASSWEHLLLILSYMRRPQTSGAMVEFVSGKTSFYQRFFEESDFNTISDGVYDPGPAAV
jgi:hypothetical protein